MTSHYRSIFRMEVFHSFFENEICKGLTYAPGPNTRQLHERYGLKLNILNNGFQCYLNSPGSPIALLNYINKTTGRSYFEFEIAASDPNFRNFTEFPTNWTGTINYSSLDAIKIADDEKISLHPQFIQNNAAVILGTIRIYFEDLINFLSINKEPIFQIRFQARKTQWRYFIVKRGEPEPGNLMIDSKSKIGFIDAGKVTLDNGQEAFLFSSADQLLPLSEEPRYNFDLIREPKSTGTSDFASTTNKIIFKGLPIPNPAQLTIIQQGRSQIMASPMFIYV